MPVKVKRVGGKFRIVETKTDSISTNKGGTAVDGGGHSSRERAMAQAAAINANSSGVPARGRDRRKKRRRRFDRGQDLA